MPYRMTPSVRHRAIEVHYYYYYYPRLSSALCNDNLSVNINSIDEPFSTNDHCLINFNLYSTVIDGSDRVDIVRNCSPSNENSILLPVYNWADGDYAAIDASLKSFDWQSLLGNIFDVDLIWSSFTSVVWPIISLYVPKRLVSHSTKYRVKNILAQYVLY